MEAQIHSRYFLQIKYILKDKEITQYVNNNLVPQDRLVSYPISQIEEILDGFKHSPTFEMLKENLINLEIKPEKSLEDITVFTAPKVSLSEKIDKEETYRRSIWSEDYRPSPRLEEDTIEIRKGFLSKTIKKQPVPLAVRGKYVLVFKFLYAPYRRSYYYKFLDKRGKLTKKPNFKNHGWRGNLEDESLRMREAYKKIKDTIKDPLFHSYVGPIDYENWLYNYKSLIFQESKKMRIRRRRMKEIAKIRKAG